MNLISAILITLWVAGWFLAAWWPSLRTRLAAVIETPPVSH
jgi:hypothetical protein